MIDGELAPPAVASGGSAPTGVDNLGGAVEVYLSSHFSGFSERRAAAGPLSPAILREIEVPLLTAALAATEATRFALRICSTSTATRYGRRFNAISTFRSIEPAADLGSGIEQFQGLRRKNTRKRRHAFSLASLRRGFVVIGQHCLYVASVRSDMSPAAARRPYSPHCRNDQRRHVWHSL